MKLRHPLQVRRVRAMLVVTGLIAGAAVAAACGAATEESVRRRLDLPAGTTQKPYAPAEGVRVAVNPPPFIWVPQAPGTRYVLQLSRDAEFRADGGREFRGLTRSVFVPRETLPPGAWFWRYGVELETGAVCARARPFEVPPDAREFPFPDLEQALERVPQERPRLFFPGVRLADARRLAQGEFRGFVAELVRACERAVGEPLVPEPAMPTSGPEQVTIMRTTRPPMDVMERCALAYLLAGDERLGQEAKRRLLHFFAWDPDGPTGFFGYDEPAMWMMMRGTRAYDWTYALFTEEERRAVEAAMKVRAAQFLRHLQSRPFESNPYESHAGRLPGFLGEAALSFTHEWPEAGEWLEYALLLYYTSYPAWGGDDGGWQEGPGYWSSYMSFVLHFVAALRAATGIDLMAKPFFRNTPYYALYTAAPYQEQTPFGDGQTGSPRRLGPVVYAFSSLLCDPYLRWYATQCGVARPQELLTLATHAPGLEPQQPNELPQARVFPAVGLVSMHTALGDKDRDVSLLLRSSPFGSVSHGHADQNAFVIDAFGRGLAIATGYYPWYGSPHHQDWTRATRAVNSVLVDGEGQVRRSWEARGEIADFYTCETWDYARGEAAGAYGDRLERFTRQVVHLRPGVFVIFDELAAPAPATYQWLLHAHEEIGIDAQRQTLEIRRAPAAMRVHLLAPAPLELRQTDRYEPEPESGEWVNTWHLTAEQARPQARCFFLSVFLPHRLGEEAALPRVERVDGLGAVGVRIAFEGGAEDMLAFRTDRDLASVECGGLTSDGDVFGRGRAVDGAEFRRILRGGARLSVAAPGSGRWASLTSPGRRTIMQS